LTTPQWKRPRIRAIFCDAKGSGESASTYPYFSGLGRFTAAAYNAKTGWE